jgi:hypothetical protein
MAYFTSHTYIVMSCYGSLYSCFHFILQVSVPVISMQPLQLQSAVIAMVTYAKYYIPSSVVLVLKAYIRSFFFFLERWEIRTKLWSERLKIGRKPMEDLCVCVRFIKDVKERVKGKGKVIPVAGCGDVVWWDVEASTFFRQLAHRWR